MATKKDLVEAYSFSRRRLVTAFVSGAPGGREVEPARPGRTIVGGLALAVLLIAGAAIAGIFAPQRPRRLGQPGLVVSKETARPTSSPSDERGRPRSLRPVINITSAKLILGADIEPRDLPQEEIDERGRRRRHRHPRRARDVPSTVRLIETGWTRLQRGRGRPGHASPSSAGRPPATGGAFLVRVGEGSYYVVAVSGEEDDEDARAYSYRCPTTRAARDNMLAALGLGSRRRQRGRGSQEWLTSSPRAPLELASFGLEARRPRRRAAATARASPTTRSSATSWTTSRRTLPRHRRAAPMPLTDFAAAVYRNLPSAQPRSPPRARSRRAARSRRIGGTTGRRTCPT